MMETYAEILQKRKETAMTNYDMDELERQGKVPNLEKIQYTHEQMITREKKSRGIRPENDWPKSVKLGKDEAPYTSIDIELPDDDFRKIALQAHERDITFNKMALLILKDGLGKSEYRFEHDSKPQLLNEEYNY